ncbi:MULTISPECIES: hypothetical protein [Streptomyces]|uniref:Secreted protein n=1 Tax=Streptomyces spinosisporus TaxID=2927582 RepID=A0ABS9XTH4_9ACTN|nr:MULTISPECIES: hypothetical protein [Streptomyces]MCI3245383.1 hypothetical protein [Streptomyces spinosisporus]WUB37701.1 hypothetical protein OHN38_23395 [Streptomyces sp. NBC_00588]
MRKPRKTLVVAVLLGTVGFLGAGTAHAQGDGHDSKHGRGHEHARGHEHGRGHGHKKEAREVHTTQFSQSTTCTTTEQNVDVQGQSGFQNGLEGNAPNASGSPGTQSTNVGSSLGCNNTITIGG